MKFDLHNIVPNTKNYTAVFAGWFARHRKFLGSQQLILRGVTVVSNLAASSRRIAPFTCINTIRQYFTAYKVCIFILWKLRTPIAYSQQKISIEAYLEMENAALREA
jgi:hypothetical protein